VSPVSDCAGEHPNATQEEIYKLAFIDRKFVSSVVTTAVTNALLEISGAQKAA
jgi:hypothetical protein